MNLIKQRILKNWKTSLTGLAIGILSLTKLLFDIELNQDLIVSILGLLGVILGLFAKD